MREQDVIELSDCNGITATGNSERQSPLEALVLLARLQIQDHDRAVGSNALFSSAHWKHNAGTDWPDVDDGSYTAFENCVHPDCALVRSALLQAQDSQPAQVAQPSNHPAFVAGPADAPSQRNPAAAK